MPKATTDTSCFQQSQLSRSPLQSHNTNNAMPSRKNGSSEAQTASRRSSLRRLSSIASFQTLFSRRRSNNTTDTVNSSSSNLSLSSSTIANAPEPAIENASSSTNHQDEDTLPELPPPPIQAYMPSRRSSYICLPDDPIGGMPRSRTFSNLPLPTRAKKTTPLVSSKSQSRLPSGFLPSTRLPSPSMSNRKHSHTRLVSAGTNMPVVRNRMKRSDTEPLLGVKGEQTSSHPRSTAFKENISLSPIKPLPAMDMSGCSDYYSLSPLSECYASLPGWQDTDESGEPFLGANFSSSPPSIAYPQHPAVRIAKEYQSSPIYRSTKDRAPTPGGSKGMDFQRWCSQPVLTNATNAVRHTNNYSEIKQSRLMSARQAPTPPPAKTPLTTQAMSSGKVKKANNSAHIRQSSDKSPIRSSSPKKKPSSPKKSNLEVHNREPPSYWCGRLCALADRYRNEELAALTKTNHQHSSSPSRSIFRSSRTNTTTTTNVPKSQTDKMHTPEATTARLRRAFESLHEICVTQEAKDSLVVFQLQYASAVRNPDLGRPIVLDAPVAGGASSSSAKGKSRDGDGNGDGNVMQRVEGEVVSSVGEGGGGGMSEGRKISFMDRLLGRQAKRTSFGFGLS